jgi:hypothetical protein
VLEAANKAARDSSPSISDDERDARDDAHDGAHELCGCFSWLRAYAPW